MSITVKNLLNWTQDTALFGVGRIPGLAARGNVVAIAAGCRVDGSGDIVKGNKTRIGAMISTNGGASFGSLSHIINLSGSGDGADDPAVLITNTGRIWVFATTTVGLSNAGDSPFSVPGAQIARIYSDDSGATWSSVDLFDLPFDYNVVSSGNGITMADGTLVLPLYVTNSGSNWKPLLLVSSDNGATWSYNSPVPAASDATESRVIEDCGYLYVITRNGNSYSPRNCWRSADLGVTWEAYSIGKLVDAGVNFGLIVRASAWYYSAPSIDGAIYGGAANKRAGGEVLSSTDKGRTWRRVCRLTPDDPQSIPQFCGYSTLAVSSAGLLCLFEGGSATQRYAELNMLTMT